MQPLRFATVASVDTGRHFASGPHLRIQTVEVSRLPRGTEPELFSGHHGEVVILCLKGRCRVHTVTSYVDLDERDQALLEEGEPFRVVSVDAETALVQMRWAPGPNPCRTCWQADGVYFADAMV